MPEQWLPLESLLTQPAPPPPAPVVPNNPDGAFIASMPAANKQPTTIPLSNKPVDTDQAFISEMPKAPNWVFMDPEKVKKAKIISSTLAMPFGPVFDNVDAAAAAFDQHDPGWFKQAGTSFMAGIGDAYITAARGAEWAGVPKSITNTYMEFGQRLQDAYLPGVKPEEFTFDKAADYRYWATTPMRSLPSMLALMPAGIVGAYAGASTAGAVGLGMFGKTVLMAAGGTLLARPIESAFEAGQSYDEAMSQGLNDAEAKARGDFVFKRNMVAGGILDFGELLAAFTPLKLLGGTANRTLTKRILAAGGKVVGKLAVTGALEGGEEAYQEAIQQMARGEQIHWSPEMKEAAAIGAVFGIGMGGAGSVFESLTARMENKMSPKMKEDFKAHEVAATALGKSPEEAKIIALDKFAETPAGKAHVEKVMGEMKDIVEGKDVAPLTQADMDKAINEAGEERPFVMGEEPTAEPQAEPDVLGGILTDEDIKAIGEGTGTIESALGMEEEAPMVKEAVPTPEEKHAAEITAAFATAKGAARTGFVDSMWERVSKGEKIPFADKAKLEGAIQAAADRGEIKSREDVAAIVEAQEPTKPNILVSEETYQTALKNIKEKSTGLHAGIDPTVLPDLVKVGAYHLERGVRNFAAWSKLMIERFGQAIEKHLPDIWAQSKDLIKRGVPSMVDLGEDVKAQVEAVTGEPQPVEAVKAQVRRTTGQDLVVKMIREDDALYAAFKKAEQASKAAYAAGGKDALAKAKGEFRDVLMKAQAKAEIYGFKEGFKVSTKLTHKAFVEAFQESSAMTKATQKMLIGYIKENLPTEVQGKFLDAIISQVSEHKAMGVMGRVDELQDKLTRRGLLNEIKGLQDFKGQHIAVDYQKKITDLLGDINTKNITAKTLAKLQGLIDYADENGMPSGVNRKMIEDLHRLNQKQASDMTTAELQSLVDIANHLTEMGKLKQQLKYKYNERERNKAKAALVQSTKSIDPKLSGKNTPYDKYKAGVHSAYMEGLTGWRVPELLDKQSDGQNVALYKELWDAEQDATWEKHRVVIDALEEIKALGFNELTEKQNIELMINIRNQERADAATLALMEKHGYQEIPALTDNEQKLIDVLKKYSDADVDRIAAYYEERKNEPFVKLPERIIPLKYEGASYVSAEEALLDDHHRTTQAQQGFTQTRKPGVKKIPRVDVLGVFELGIDEQKWYVNVQPAIDEAAKLVKSKEYLDAAGEVGANWWADHLDIMARRGWAASAHYSKFGAALKAARGNITKAILGYKLSTIIMQPLAVFDAMAYAHGKWGGTTALQIVNEVTKAWIIPGKAKTTVAGSKKLQLRAGTGGEASMQEAMQASKQSKFIQGSMKMMLAADLKTAAGVKTAFENILAKQGVADAAHQAEMLMDMVSSSSDVSFRPHVLARGELARTWFTFGTFALNRWSIIAHDLVGQGIKRGDWKQRYTAALGLGIIIAGTIAEDQARKYLYEMVNGKTRKQRSILLDMIYALPRNIPIFGDIFSPFTGGGGSEPPLQKVIGDLFGGAKGVIQGKPSAKARAVFKAAEAVGALRGIPGSAQAADLIERIFLPESKSSGGGRVELGPQK